MSYILDALKKAEAERQMGHVPHLHAHQPGAAALPVIQPFYRKKPVLLTLLAVAVASAIIAGYLRWQPSSSSLQSGPIATAAQHTAPPAQASPAALPPVAIDTEPEIVAVSPVPPKPKAAPSPDAVKPKKPPPAAAKKPAREPVAPAMPTETTTAKPNPENTGFKRHAALTPEVSSTPQAGSIADLPEQIRRELPNVVIGGYIYSDNARERQLLVNKRLLREGEEAAPGVVLEKMQPKAAVFNYKGYRYRLAY